MLLWRRGTSVLTAGHLKITRDSRFKIVGDYNLQIANVRTQDAGYYCFKWKKKEKKNIFRTHLFQCLYSIGDYICQIGDQETRDQVHTVEILGKL